MKNKRRFLMILLTAVFLTTGSLPVSAAQAQETVTENVEVKATAADKATASSDISTYGANLIQINRLDAASAKQINALITKAQNYINGSFSGSPENLNSYTAQVKSRMDAVVSAQPKETGQLLALGDTYQTLTVQHGQKVSLILPIVSYAPVAISDVVIEPEISGKVAEWPFAPESTGMTQVIKSFPPYNADGDINDARQEVSFSFTVRDDVMTGYYPLKFTLTYQRNNAVETASVIIYVKAVGTSDSGRLDGTQDSNKDKLISKPRVIVTGFETNPSQVFAGEKFKLTIHLQNTSTTSMVKNMLCDLQADIEGSDKTTTFAAFLPTSGASSTYIESMAPGAGTDIVIEMSAKSDLAQKPYVLVVNMKYDSDEAVDLTDTANVSVPVYQQSKCETGDVALTPEVIQVGEQSNITFDVYNTGKTTLYNTWVKFQADSISGGDTYLGTIAPGGTGSVDAMLSGQNVTQDDGIVRLQITYENESGEVISVDKDFTLTVTEPETVYDEELYNEDMTNMTDMDHQEKLKKVRTVCLAAAGCVLLMVVLAIIIRKHKKSVSPKTVERKQKKDGR